MTRGLLAVALGLVIFIMITTLIRTVVTGTDTGSVVIQNVLGLTVAIGIVIAALSTFLKA